MDGDTDTVVSEIRDALAFDPDVEARKRDELLSIFNEEQREAFATINESVINGEGKCFFVDGAGGCGKTTVAKALLHATRGRRDIAIACASSGIASTLLPKGQTAHSAFKIPVEGLNADSTCNVGGQTGRDELLRQVKFIVWDEVFMIHRSLRVRRCFANITTFKKQQKTHTRRLYSAHTGRSETDSTCFTKGVPGTDH